MIPHRPRFGKGKALLLWTGPRRGRYTTLIPCPPAPRTTMPSQNRLPFEKDIAALEEAIARLEAEANGSPDASEERREALRRMRRDLVTLIKDVYGKLSPWDTILVARHGERPQTMDYV